MRNRLNINRIWTEGCCGVWRVLCHGFRDLAAFSCLEDVHRSQANDRAPHDHIVQTISQKIFRYHALSCTPLSHTPCSSNVLACLRLPSIYSRMLNPIYAGSVHCVREERRSVVSRYIIVVLSMNKSDSILMRALFAPTNVICDASLC